jgi:hypothetical protein
MWRVRGAGRVPSLAVLSIVGVGITPPKVLGTPKPASSVMISNTLGAPLDGTTRGGHHDFDWRASSLITPPNFGSGGGSWVPGIVVVAEGEPGVPVTCWAETGIAVSGMSNMAANAPHRAARLRSFGDSIMNYPLRRFG